jgi:hypothetical protein
MFLANPDEPLRTRFSDQLPGAELDRIEILGIEDLALHRVPGVEYVHPDVPLCSSGRENDSDGSRLTRQASFTVAAARATQVLDRCLAGTDADDLFAVAEPVCVGPSAACSPALR